MKKRKKLSWGVGLIIVAFFLCPNSFALFAQSDPAAPFQPGITIAGDLAGAHSVQTADLDQDSDLDVIAAGRVSGKVMWYQNDGSAVPQFSAHEVGFVQGAYIAYPADLDGDGDSDILVAGVGELRPSGVEESPGATGEIVWFVNNLHTGGFFMRQVIATGLNYPVKLLTADLDHDADLDIVGAVRDANAVLWFENNGASPPGFTSRVISGNARGAAGVHVGDMDGDGDIDILSASEDDNKIAWYANDGVRPPNFTEQVIHQSAPPNPEDDYAKAVYAADIDQDGDVDVAYASEDNHEIGWFENLEGSPPGFAPHVVSNEANHAKAVIVIDVDQDGDSDLLSASGEDNKIAWYENDGATPPNFITHVLTTAAVGAHAVHVADLDGDGDLDVLSASRDDNRITWHPNQTMHRSALLNGQTEFLVARRSEARSVYAADMDRDGEMDILSISDGEVAWHANDGASPPAFTNYTIMTGLLGGRWVYAADLDQDSDIDVLSASKDDGKIFWYENSGGQPPTFASHLVTDQALGVRTVLSADLDGDGDLDLYGTIDNDDLVFWFEQLPGSPPSFTPHVISDYAGYARSVYAADLDNDGDLDLTSAAQYANEVAWHENLGGTPARFRNHIVAHNIDGVQHVHAADMDGDGDTDIVSAADLAGAIHWFESDGTIRPEFTVHLIKTKAPGAHAVYTGDMDRDGDPDIVAAIEGTNTIAWYENNGARPPAFVEHVVVNNAQEAHGIYAEDVDGDGDLDVLAASKGDGEIAWYENQGGQYALTTQEQPYPDFDLSLTVSHRGRPGDANLELNALEFQFVNSAGAPLTTAQVNNLVRELQVYRLNCCENRFDPSQNPLLITVAPLILSADGRLVIDLPDDDPNLQTPVGGATTYLVKAESLGGCQSGAALFRMINVLSGRVAQDSNTDLPLLAETMRSLHFDTLPVEDEGPPLLINEFMASNDAGLQDPDEPGEYVDWIELFNTTDQPIDLGGNYLTDDLLNPQKYRIPAGVWIAAHGYLVFYADEEPIQGPLHTNFRLEKNGEAIGLFASEAAGGQTIDTRVFGVQLPNVAEGRYPNGSDTWQSLGSATPGQFNADQLQTNPIFLPLITVSPVCLQ